MRCGLSGKEEVCFIILIFSWYFVIYEQELFLCFGNWRKRTSNACIYAYVTKTTPNNLILIFSYPLVCLACCIKTPINAPITPGVQANENTAAKNFQISELQMVLRKS